MITLDTASPTDLPSIRSLLTDAGLPLDGLMEPPTHFVVARQGDRLVGAGAVEQHGDSGLLRSLVVAPEARSTGIGSGIVTELERWADEVGLSGTYLLTDTAEQFFARRGYRRIGRTDAPPAVKASVEWAIACDESCIAMVR
ncbi:MAG: arsenic resistance N-acetyltransferase ArsN2 [Actinomycetota bacterium]